VTPAGDQMKEVEMPAADRIATPPGSLAQAPSRNDRLVVVARFPDFSPDLLFAYWTTPELLCRWWPQEAEIDPRVGGDYRLSWPQMNWHLRGRYTEFAPGQRLAFTWKWDHQPEYPSAHIVRVLLEPLAGAGTQVTLTHGPYGDSQAEQEVRDGHLEGWTHFLTRLRQLQAHA
jgi:uncharacterized protein YndB with AHSA1/START domain